MAEMAIACICGHISYKLMLIKLMFSVIIITLMSLLFFLNQS